SRLEANVRAALETDPKKRTPEQEKLAKEAEPILKVTWDEILAAMTTEDRQKRSELREKQHAIEAGLPYPPSQAWAVVDDGKFVPTYVLKRGDIKKRTALVDPAFVRIVSRGPEPQTNYRLGLAGLIGGLAQPPARLSRLDLARWLTQPNH